MLKTEDLVEYVRRTNPGMDKEKLLEELSKIDSSAVALIYRSEERRVGKECRL